MTSRRPTLTFIVPAHNEEEGLPATLESLLRQTEPAQEIIVVNDGSTDRTHEVAASYGVTVLDAPGTGSKAGAQNYALPHCTTDLVLPVDADTVLADDYAALIRDPFADPNVAIAAGCVMTRFTNTVWERGRQIEYLFGFHWFRPVQQAYGSPVVCSGCCSAFRTDMLRAFGGFPARTIVEDIDYSWSQQIAGHRAVYVADAVAYAAEPINAKFMKKQLWRWKSGYFQNVRQHARGLITRKRWLALWVGLSVAEILLSPVMLTLPVWWATHGHSALSVAAWWIGGEALTLAPALAYATAKRKINPLKVIACYPSFYVLKFFNAYYDWKALINELVLVPLGLSRGLHVYEKGRADARRRRHAGAHRGLLASKPQPVAADPVPVDDDTVRIPLVKLYDPDTERTLQTVLPAR